MSQRLQISLYAALLFLASQSFHNTPSRTAGVAAQRSRLCSVLLCNPRLVVLGRPNMHKKTPWKTVKMAPIYDFPRAARAEHGHGAKKVLAGVRFQWTDTQNDICIGRADKFSGWEPLLEPSKPFLLLFERVASLR